MTLTNRPDPADDTPGSDEELDLAADGDLPEPIVFALRPEEGGERLDKILSRRITQYSRSRIQQWIEEGHVLLDGKVARGKTLVFGDESVSVQPQPGLDAHAFEPEAMPLDVVLEDAALIVINKAPGIVVHPGAGNWSGTLLNGLLHRFPELARVPRAGIVHRLDKDTSGLMVVARTLEAQTALVRQLQERTVRRHYLALVWGRPALSGTIDAAIARHPRERVRMAVSESQLAKPAVTHYRLIAAGMLDGKPVSVVQCRLETGRTHQIRVHMQSLGFALVGDPLYGKPHLAGHFPRQALHAYQLGLEHPLTHAPHQWRAALPEDIAKLLVLAGVDPDLPENG